MHWRGNTNRALLVVTAVLLVVTLGTIGQSVYRQRQALALEEELEEIYVLSETDYETARDRYITLLPDIWAVQEGERQPIVRAKFVTSLACKPTSPGETCGSGGGRGRTCPPNCDRNRPLYEQINNIPPSYNRWFNTMQQCTGLSGNFNDITWVQVNSHRIYQEGPNTAGAFDPNRNTIFLARPFVADSLVVSHEMGHYLDRNSGYTGPPHASRTFQQCGSAFFPLDSLRGR